MLVWGRWRRLPDSEVCLAIEAWRARLGIERPVRLKRISRYQVVDHRGRKGCSLVGVTWDDCSACIYHTRALTAEDVVHELLHVAHPDWPEREVVAETARLLLGESRGASLDPGSLRPSGNPRRRSGIPDPTAAAAPSTPGV